MAQTSSNPYDGIELPKLDEMLKRLSEFLYSAVKRNISSGGNPPWPPRKTSPWRPMGHPPLMATGRLFGSLRASFDVDAGVARVDTSAGDAKTQMIAHVHNFGAVGYQIPVTEKSRRYFLFMFQKTGDPAWKRMWLSDRLSFTATTPRRRFLWLAPEDIQKAKEIVGGLPLTITDGKDTIYA